MAETTTPGIGSAAPHQAAADQAEQYGADETAPEPGSSRADLRRQRTRRRWVTLTCRRSWRSSSPRCCCTSPRGPTSDRGLLLARTLVAGSTRRSTSDRPQGYTFDPVQRPPLYPPHSWCGTAAGRRSTRGSSRAWATSASRCRSPGWCSLPVRLPDAAGGLGPHRAGVVVLAAVLPGLRGVLPRHGLRLRPLPGLAADLPRRWCQPAPVHPPPLPVGRAGRGAVRLGVRLRPLVGVVLLVAAVLVERGPGLLARRAAAASSRSPASASCSSPTSGGSGTGRPTSRCSRNSPTASTTRSRLRHAFTGGPTAKYPSRARTPGTTTSTAGADRVRRGARHRPRRVDAPPSARWPRGVGHPQLHGDLLAGAPRGRAQPGSLPDGGTPRPLRCPLHADCRLRSRWCSSGHPRSSPWA